MTANPTLWYAVLSILLLTPKAGCEEKSPVRKIDTLKSMAELDDSQRLKPGYVISIRIVEDRREALQQVVAVTGEIQAPYVGLIKAEGLTCRELAFRIKPELAKIDKSSIGDYMRSAKLGENFFEEATVLVTLDDMEPPRSHDIDLPFVVAFGNISRQGKYPFEQVPEHKLSGLIKLAGGLTSKDAIPKIRVIRKTAQGNKTITIDSKALLNKSTKADLILQASDVIIVD